MNILILTGKFGMGHWSASQSLRQQIMAEGFHGAQVVDFIEYALPGTSEAVYRSFSLLVTHGSGLYNTYYKMTENLGSEGRPLLERRFLDKLEDLLAEQKPDAIIATHPLCAQLVSRYKLETGSDIPLVTCITDLTAHSEWLTHGTDLYLVGAADLIAPICAKGVAEERIVVTGIPVKRQFYTTNHCRGEGKRRLLIMGGGLGLLPRKERFYEELNALQDVETTIIAGRNEKLYQRLEGKYENIRVLGYTDKVYDLMAGADLLLSKPGGITLFEAIATELPMLSWEPLLQQEINNGHFMTSMGLGGVAAMELEDCVAVIDDLIHNDGTLAWMAGNMRRLKESLCPTPITDLISSILTEREVINHAG